MTTTACGCTLIGDVLVASWGYVTPGLGAEIRTTSDRLAVPQPEGRQKGRSYRRMSCQFGTGENDFPVVHGTGRAGLSGECWRGLLGIDLGIR